MLFQSCFGGNRIHILILFEMSPRTVQNAKLSFPHIPVLARVT